ncbi:efflux RND transporter permease subunit [Vibrio sp. ZSDZ65]|uniref:Efflux RND transporter permease subunit n=1 Tax=Vibrio qingdaonensis TaxID=2829491 RepID=A0A9X3CM97_9VIBR|nr:efflux RND transporter permease subunit [Vibrio qingdaonensis]MCW8344985.1 efflux RND transporter permease subunit [Vibrio qingdaonensis]
MNQLITLIQRFPKCILLFVLALTAASAWYGQQHFKMNADLSSLVKQDGAWVDNLAHLEEAFPETGNVVVLVTSQDGELAKQSVESLADELASSSVIKDVFAPSTLSWFQQHALGFIDDSDYQTLEKMVSQQVAPLVAGANAQRLEVYLGQLIDRNSHIATRALGSDSSVERDKANENILEPLLLAASGQKFDWARELSGHITSPTAYAITLVAQPDDSVKEPNRAIIEAIHHAVTAAELPSSVAVQITGQAALDFDEIVDANNSIAIAGSASLIGLVLILAIGIRSLRVIVACYLTVIIGLVWTFAAGLFVVGSYNTISIVFMVMFIGLAVDFSIHLCLHIQELRIKGEDNRHSLTHAVAHSFRPLALCALSSGIGFLSFYPTAYTGLGELGIVSALGMLLGLLATFVVIPLFFTLFGYPTVKHKTDTRYFSAFGHGLATYKRTITFLMVCLSLVMGYGATQFKFDFSTLVLKNPQSESVLGLYALQQHGLGSSYQLYAVAKNEQEAKQWKSQLLNEPTISQVIIASDFMPTELAQRTQQLSDVLQPNMTAKPLSLSEFKRLAVEKGWPNAERIPTMANDSADLGSLTQALFSSVDSDTLSAITSNATGLNIDEDLPRSLYQRYISKQGEWLVAITPLGDMSNVEELNQFISDVQFIAPNATGRAVAEKEVGGIVVDAFRAAILMSILAIALILIWTVNKKRDIVLIFIPLGLATITTLGMMYWLNLSMNMANIIVVPLIFGLGVDNGIHIVKRFRAVGSLEGFFKTSTPKASLISCLTTLATFGALIVAKHQGMHSIGMVLTIALSSILVYSLVLLPIMLEATKKSEKISEVEASSKER